MVVLHRKVMMRHLLGAALPPKVVVVENIHKRCLSAILSVGNAINNAVSESSPPGEENGRSFAFGRSFHSSNNGTASLGAYILITLQKIHTYT